MSSIISKMSDDIRHHRITLSCNLPLKNCPFCGGEAAAKYVIGYYDTPSIIVYCKKCRARTESKGFMCGIMREGATSWHTVTESEALEEAVAVWNNRTLAARRATV